MSQIKISSTDWLGISFRNGTTGLFNLANIYAWQYFKNEEINRNLIDFSPNGQFFVFNGENKELNIYILTNLKQTDQWWILQKNIVMKNPLSALKLTDKDLFFADMNGDVYQIDLLQKDKNQNCIIKNISMILDIAFLENKSFLITADQTEKIRVNLYPNTSQIQGYCLGHTEFISQIKLIDQHHLVSASGDGKYLFHFFN